jgi:hypothetical protein
LKLWRYNPVAGKVNIAPLHDDLTDLIHIPPFFPTADLKWGVSTFSLCGIPFDTRSQTGGCSNGEKKEGSEYVKDFTEHKILITI